MDAMTDRNCSTCVHCQNSRCECVRSVHYKSRVVGHAWEMLCILHDDGQLKGQEAIRAGLRKSYPIFVAP